MVGHGLVPGQSGEQPYSGTGHPAETFNPADDDPGGLTPSVRHECDRVKEVCATLPCKLPVQVAGRILVVGEDDDLLALQRLELGILLGLDIPDPVPDPGQRVNVVLRVAGRRAAVSGLTAWDRGLAGLRAPHGPPRWRPGRPPGLLVCCRPLHPRAPGNAWPSGTMCCPAPSHPAHSSRRCG